MDATRREEILRAYAGHARRFADIASRPHDPTGLFPADHAPATPQVRLPAPSPVTGLFRRRSADSGELTARELDVLALVAQGLSNEEIGERLEITVETVKTHVQHLLQRLGARNRAHAVSLGYLRGLLL